MCGVCIYACVHVCVCACVVVCPSVCPSVPYPLIEYLYHHMIDSLPRVEDSMYLSPLSELAKKRQQEQNVPVEPGVFRIEDPPLCVADPSRYVYVIII